MPFSRNAIAVASSVMLLAGGALAADDSIVNTQGSTSTSTGGSPDKGTFLGNVHPMMISGEYFLSSTSNPKARCRKSELTQEHFLEMVDAIVKHGDLTDKAFIEKTLQIKWDNRVPHREGLYSTYGDTPNFPIQVILNLVGTSFVDRAGNTQNGKELSFWELDMVGAVFHNCQYLTKRQFQQNFANFSRGEFQKDPWVLDLGKVGRNSSDIQIHYLPSTHEDGLKKDALETVTIFQRSESIPNK